MEVKEEYGLNVHAIVTVEDIHEYLVKQSGEYDDILPAMEEVHGKITASCKSE
jgi:orotate phosphoribosyltransferase